MALAFVRALQRQSRSSGDALQIQCIIALAENNPEKGVKYRHAWNVVRLDKKYYHLDCTFDLSLGNPEEIRYDYFLLSDKQIFRDHERLVWRVPACEDADRFYYKKKKLSFTKTEEVQKRAAQAVKKGKPLLFHWQRRLYDKGNRAGISADFQGRSGEERKIRAGFAELGAGDCEGTLYRTITDTGIDDGRSQ